MSGLPRGADSRIVSVPAIGLLIELCCRGSAGGALVFSALFVPVENKPVPARAYKGKKWEPVGFPQAKLLYLLKKTGSRFFLSFGNRFWEVYLRYR